MGAAALHRAAGRSTMLVTAIVSVVKDKGRCSAPANPYVWRMAVATSRRPKLLCRCEKRTSVGERAAG